MAQIIYSSLVNSISGRFAGSVLARGNASLRRHNAGLHNPRSEKQQTNRGHFSDLCGAWYALSDTQKSLWNTYAAMATRTGSGFNAFVGLNGKLLAAGHSDLTTINAPPPSPTTPPPVAGLVPAREEGTTTITWDTPQDPDTYIEIYVSVPVGYFSEHKPKWMHVGTVRSDTGTFTHTHEFPSDIQLIYTALGLDHYGRSSPICGRTPTVEPQPVTWTYTVLVNNSANANALADYQVKLTVPADSAVYDHAQADGGNIRFFDADGVTSLSYWMESWVYGGISVFWINVPSIPGSSTKNIYMHAIAPTVVTTSSAENTFILYDGFSGDTIDATKWIERAAGLHVASGHLVFTYTGAQRGHIDSIITFPYPAICETRWYASTTVSNLSHPGVLRQSGNWNNRVDYWGSTLVSQFNFSSIKEGVQTYTGNVLLSDITAYHVYKEVWELNRRRFYQDNSLKLAHTTNVPIVNMCVSFLELDTSTNPLYIDWVRVRAFAEPEPTAALI